MATMRMLLFLAIIYSAGIREISSVTDPSDAAVLKSLMDAWQNTPPSWNMSNDPCDFPWDGVICNNSRVYELRLSSRGLQGELIAEIGELTELTFLDLSENPGLTGPLPPRLGDLRKLNVLFLGECSFNGTIPDELGNLSELTDLSLYLNHISGAIPPSLGKLSKLQWISLARNQLTGPIPISNSTSPGLDLLLKVTNLLLDQNQLSGPIPPELFSSEMALTDLLLYNNRFTGSIPITLGLVRTLEILRLDTNALTGMIPANLLNNFTNITGIDLGHNYFTGPLPDLSGLNFLEYVDLSNNSFVPSEAPLWFSTLPSLANLIIEYGSLHGSVPEKLFSHPQLYQVNLKSNALNGTLTTGDIISPYLHFIDLQNNQISDLVLSHAYQNSTLMLAGNPICSNSSGASNATFCQPPH